MPGTLVSAGTTPSTPTVRMLALPATSTAWPARNRPADRLDCGTSPAPATRGVPAGGAAAGRAPAGDQGRAGGEAGARRGVGGQPSDDVRRRHHRRRDRGVEAESGELTVAE